MQTRISTPPHYIIPHQPDFLYDKFTLELTSDSKELFELGDSGQGYIGLVDLVTGEVHLVPSFNKNDGLLRLDKNGNKFKRYAESSQALGTLTGDLHTNCTSILKLGDKGGQAGKLMGFGIWKAGLTVKFLSTMPGIGALIPDELLLINENGKWELISVDQDKNTAIIALEDIEGLHELLISLPNKAPELLTKLERKAIESLLQSQFLLQGNHKNGLKLIKNRSSSQNFYSVNYNEIYVEYFNVSVQNHQAHTLNLKRELPLQVFEKILQAVCIGLNIDPIENLDENPIVPNGPDALRDHFKIESIWLRAPEAVNGHLFKQLATQGDNGIHTMLRFLKLNDVSLLKIPDNFQALADLIQKKPHLAFDTLSAFKQLYAKNIFINEKNFVAFIKLFFNEQIADDLGEVLCSLCEYQILTAFNFEMFDLSKNFKALVSTLSVLDKLNAVKPLSENDPKKNFEFFCKLFQNLSANDFDDSSEEESDNDSALDKCTYLLNIKLTILCLKNNNILANDANFENIVDLLLEYPPEIILELLQLFKAAGFLSDEYFPTVLMLIRESDEKLQSLRRILKVFCKKIENLEADCTLEKMNKDLERAYYFNLFQSISDLQNVESVAVILYNLNKIDVLTNENFTGTIEFLAQNPMHAGQMNLAFEMLMTSRFLTAKTLPIFIKQMAKDIDNVDQITTALASANSSLLLRISSYADTQPDKVVLFVENLIQLNKQSVNSNFSTLFKPAPDEMQSALTSSALKPN